MIISKEVGMLETYEIFCKNDMEFNIVSGENQSIQAEKLLVLDSSFNPPHMGHYTLIKKAVQLYEESKLHILLLLSMNNADKDPKPASFDRRLEMMCILSDILTKECIDNSVGLTKYGKFVDKSDCIKKLNFFNGDIIYLVGFDTIVRILDSKYYAPLLPSEALRHFMSDTEFVCITREGNIPESDQIRYPLEISKGVYEPAISSFWGVKIHVLRNDKKYSSVSSSSIRKSLKNNIPSKTLKDEIPQAILDFIENSKSPIF